MGVTPATERRRSVIVRYQGHQSVPLTAGSAAVIDRSTWVEDLIRPARPVTPVLKRWLGVDESVEGSSFMQSEP